MRLLLLVVAGFTAAVALGSQCAGPPMRENGAAWYGWADAAHTGFQNAKSAGLNSQTTPKLKRKWAFGFPGVMTAQGTPTVFGGRVYGGDANGVVYSLDAQN